MCRYPHALRGDITQQVVEQATVGAILNRIHPYEHAVELQQLTPHIVDSIVRVHHVLGCSAELFECLEEWPKQCVRALGRGCGATGASVEQSNSSHSSSVQTRTAQSIEY